jgi:hypothetical protein
MVPPVAATFMVVVPSQTALIEVHTGIKSGFLGVFGLQEEAKGNVRANQERSAATGKYHSGAINDM